MYIFGDIDLIFQILVFKHFQVIYHLNLIFWINSFLLKLVLTSLIVLVYRLKSFCIFFITISVLCVQMPMIKLQSLEGEVFEIDVEIARQSVTIKTMLEGNQKLFYSVYRPIVFIEKWKYIKSFCTPKKWITSSSCQKGFGWIIFTFPKECVR